MCDNPSPFRPIGEEITLQVITIAKWPLLVFFIWFLLPDDSFTSFLKILKENKVKELGIGNAKMVLDTNDKVKTLKNANDLKNLSSELKGELSKISESKKDENLGKLKALESKVDEIESSSSELIKRQLPVFVPNAEASYNLNMEGKVESVFHFEIFNLQNKSIEVKIGIDKFPFSYTFDLCETTGKYKNLKSVSDDVNGQITKLEYSDEKVDCKGAIKVEKFKEDSYLYAYNFNMLSGFNIAKIKNYDVFLPVTLHRSISNSIYSSGMNPVISSQYRQGKLIEQTKVFIK